MKILVLKVLIIAIAFIASLNNLFCVDWTKLTSKPCDTSLDSIQPKNGPFTLKICQNDIDFLPPCYQYPCCYTIVYYDRWVPPTGLNSDYEVFPVGIFTDNDSTCFSCSKNDIINAFYKKLISTKSLDTNFMKRLKLDTLGNTIETTQYMWSKAKCYYNDTILCDKNLRCCQTNYRLKYNDGGDLLDVSNLFDATYPLCPLSCQTSCRQTDFHSTKDTFCVDIPCNQEAWTPDSTSFIPLTLWNCPQCSVKIYYENRTAYCNPPYNDTRITKIVLNNDSLCFYQCLGDTMPSFAMVYWWCVDSILKQKGRLIPILQCDTTFRTVHYSCWEHNSFNHQYEPCITSGCCWAIYKICRIDLSVVTISKIDSSTQQAVCNQAALPCQYICDEPGMPRIGEEDEQGSNLNPKLIFYPNPASDLLNFILLNTKGRLVSLKIYDRLGNIWLTETLKSAVNPYQITLNLERFNSGVYVYEVSIDNIHFESGKVIVVK